MSKKLILLVLLIIAIVMPTIYILGNRTNGASEDLFIQEVNPSSNLPYKLLDQGNGESMEWCIVEVGNYSNDNFLNEANFEKNSYCDSLSQQMSAAKMKITSSYMFDIGRKYSKNRDEGVYVLVVVQLDDDLERATGRLFICRYLN